MSDDKHIIPEHIKKEFEDDLDDHVQRLTRHLDQKEKEHKQIDKLLTVPK